MTGQHVNEINLDYIPDPHTEAMLLPDCWAMHDNSRKISHYKRALQQAFQQCLTPKQQEQVRLYYQDGICKSDIARQQHSTCSAVSRSMHAAEQALKEYIELYMQIYNQLEQEFLCDEYWR